MFKKTGNFDILARSLCVCVYTPRISNIVIFVFAEKPAEEQQTFSSPLLHIEGFLLALTNADKDGRVVISKQGWLV